MLADFGGGKGEFDFDLHAQRRISYIGVTHRTRSIEELREETRAMWADLANAVTAGKLRLPIDKRYPLDQANAAQRVHASQPAFRQNSADPLGVPKTHPRLQS